VPQPEPVMRMTAIVAGLMLWASGSPIVASSPPPMRPPPVPARQTGTPPPLPAPVRYSAPLPVLQVVRAFDPPTTRYGPGHLGVDITAQPGASVRAAGTGVVRVAAMIAGRGVVVVQHPDGVRTEYEPVRPSVSVGAVVRRGQVLGVVRGTHGRCATGRCLHWGARRLGAYFDPLTLLSGLGPVRLLPWTR
jgi:murein DD-endopeptidase MepM/ murein hydrolase activator NlpD